MCVAGFALDGMHCYKEWQSYLQDSTAEAKFTETGALWMLGYDRAQNDAMVERLNKFNVKGDVLDADAMKEKFPLLSTEPFPTYDDEGNEVTPDTGPFSAVYEHGCGHLDSSTCLTDLHKACVRDGIDIRFNQRVASFDTTADGAKVQGVTMEDGSKIGAGVVVNASGPWFNKLNETAGVNLSTTALPVRIQVGHTLTLTLTLLLTLTTTLTPTPTLTLTLTLIQVGHKYVPDEFCSLPFVADGYGPSGIYFMPRAANNQLVFGSVAHRFESEVVDPDDYNTSLDPDVKQDYLNCLFHRMPTLPRDGEIVGFSSMYTVNQDDVHPMIGETAVGGLWACNGFSGHGFKLAPAVGSLVAQQVTGLKTDAWETSMATDFMGPYREPLKLKQKTHFA